MEGTGVIMITEEEFDEAVAAEMRNVLSENPGKTGGAMIFAMAGASFAHAVWKRLTGEKE